jgi:hypothetical protein
MSDELRLYFFECGSLKRRRLETTNQLGLRFRTTLDDGAASTRFEWTTMP